MEQIHILRTIYKMRRVIAAFVLVEWVYKVHKSRPAIWVTERKRKLK